MAEFTLAVLVCLCGMLYWLGGQELPYLNRGYKWLRRFGVPIVVAIGLHLLNINPLVITMVTGLLCISLHLGYQSSLLKYLVVGACMGLPSLFVGSHFWYFPILAHGGLGFLSLKDNSFRWAMVALATGWSIGVAYLSGG